MDSEQNLVEKRLDKTTVSSYRWHIGFLYVMQLVSVLGLAAVNRWSGWQTMHGFETLVLVFQFFAIGSGIALVTYGSADKGRVRFVSHMLCLLGLSFILIRLSQARTDWVLDMVTFLGYVGFITSEFIDGRNRDVPVEYLKLRERAKSRT